LLQRPGIAVGIAEGDERAPRLDVYFAHCHAVAYEMLSGGLDILDDDLHASLRSWRHIGDTSSEHHRAGGSGGRELYEAQRIVDLVVVVSVKTNLVDVKGLCPIDVGHGNGHKLKFPVHGRNLSSEVDLICRSRCHNVCIPNYDQFAKFYDLVMGDRGGDGGWVIDCLHRYGKHITSLLELGCGTGSILTQITTVPSITGLDLSSEMLALARSRVPNARLIETDIASFSLGEEFDVVICVFDTLNHLVTFDSWVSLFAATSRHLRVGGLFMFDVNTQSKLQRLCEAPPWVQEFDDCIIIMDVRPGKDGITDWEIKIFEHIDGPRFDLHRELIGELGVSLEMIKEELSPLFDLVEESDENGNPPTDGSSRAQFVYRKR
jgi:SAM-dependent methyltransferase